MAIFSLGLVTACNASDVDPADLPQQLDPAFVAAQARLADAREQKAIDGPARNIILFIGDGMSVTTVTAARIYEGQQRGATGEENFLSFEKFPYLALSKTYNTDMQTPDSAGTASAIVTGVKTKMGFISVGATAKRGDCASSQSAKLTTILELAERAGLSTGVVSTAPVTHATPATSYAHTPERNWGVDRAMPEEARAAGCRDIAAQLIEFPHGDGLEVAFGGGRSHFLPTPADSEGAPGRAAPALRADGRDLTREWSSKYQNSAYVTTAAELATIEPGAVDHVLGLFAAGGMKYEADRARDPEGQPSLSEMTARAIDILSKNPNGYFLMVEGAEIDWAHHDGNAARALIETVEYANAVTTALSKTDPRETLIIVTADHAHTLTMAGYSKRGNPILGLAANDEGLVLAKDGKPYTTLSYANGKTVPVGVHERADLTGVDTTDIDFRQQATVPVRAETHGGDDVPIYSKGPLAHLLTGVVEENYIFHVMEAAGNLRARAAAKSRNPN
ncbi:MAG: alkaline phosphatase [Sphingomonadales bacterium]